MKPRIAAFTLAVATTVAMGGLAIRAAGAEQHGAPAQTTAGPADQADMMKRHQQMMADMKKADSELTALVTRMNAATGNEKVDAIAAIVTELARRQASMHERMGQMHMMMMGGHPQSGGQSQGGAADQHKH